CLVDSKSYLNKCLGTGYPNYIFYKLEYILWKDRVGICEEKGLNLEKWNKFRLIAKNSVEHIFPQHQKEENKHIHYLSEEELTDCNLNEQHPIDDFGNLVLISPGMNSEYSNMPYKQKKGKYDSKTEIDSLKSDLIFKNGDWNWKLAQEHKNEMIVLLEKYINKLKTK
ncbi:HNH endonuclease family protein, partial [Sphingobacterium rhinopitheci]|uniref:HNH endonuclease family protein n=1 Tax=Sphingobacterium rhinopitheci TaxID=2781960 RepID=UPI001F52587C